LTALLLADSERTASSILADKELTSGAFVVGLIANLDWPADDPVGALNRIMPDSTSAGSIVAQTSPETVVIQRVGSSARTSSDELTGVGFEARGDPTGIFSSGGEKLYNRILLFPAGAETGVQTKNTPAIFIFSAPLGDFDVYREIFVRMAETITIYDTGPGFSINDGSATVLGELQDREPVNGKLDRGVKDLWTFDTVGSRYATITLSPIDRDIDLTIMVINPSGIAMSRIDSGYAGIVEVAADLFLPDEGRHLIEIGEVFGDSGRYRLSLALSDAPSLRSDERIEAGQGIQSDLPEGAEHIWSFAGSAGQLVSIVLTPGHDQFDGILHLYDPEGNRLVALDEGFSGDAEVLAGFELPVTGEYEILVRSFAGNSGVYSLSLDDGGESTRNFFDAGDLKDGDIKSETLRTNEAHVWFFSGRAGDAVTIEVVPLDEYLDLDIWLLDPDVTRIATEDRFAAAETESIESILSQDGQYLVFIRDFQGESGAYELRFTSIRNNLPEDAGILTYGQSVTGTLAPGQPVIWRFRGDIDDVLDLSLTPLDGMTDLLFVLQDPATNTVLRVDGTLAGQREVLSGFTITANGLWRVVVSDFFGEGGRYTLSIRRSQP
jgi:hypothetical protein